MTLLNWSSRPKPRGIPRLKSVPLASLHLVADGQRIEPVVSGLVARFFVPTQTRQLTLVSRTARPCDVFDTEDRRDLGVCLAGIMIVDGLHADERIALDDPRLCVGLHAVEEGYRRWTSGPMPLPTDVVAAHADGFILRIELAGPAIC